MDPPVYTPPASSSIKRTIIDLRTQIIANASILRPNYNNDRPSDDHIELVVAKAPANAAVAYSSGEKRHSHAYASASSSSSEPAGLHYAVLCKRSGAKKDVRIILKGERRATVEEALEWMLERTQLEIHNAVLTYGKDAGDGGCTVM